MKTNKMLRISAILLVLTLLSTCVISGTFAKYVTKGEATDTAKVAKWGVTIDAITAANNDLFVDVYKNESSKVTVKAVEDVLAPGTSGNLTKFVIKGTPEVAVKITYSADLKLENWLVDKNSDNTPETEYFPVVFNVEGKEFKISSEYPSIGDLEYAIEQYIANYSKEYEPNTNLETNQTVLEETLSISWSWAYETVGNDVNDTLLGDQAANGNPAKITLDLTVTVTQVD